jgi:hypothetical protein
MAYHKTCNNISEELELTYNEQYMLSRVENDIWKRNPWTTECEDVVVVGGGGGDDDNDDDYNDAGHYNHPNDNDSKLLETEIILNTLIAEVWHCSKP